MSMEMLENNLLTEEQAPQMENLPEMPEPPQETPGESPEETPKRKRASRKKAEKPEEPAVDNLEGGGEPPASEEPPPDEELSEADRLDPKAGAVEDCVVVGLAEQGDDPPPPPEPGEDSFTEEPPPLEDDAAPETGQPEAGEPVRRAVPRTGRAGEGRRPLLSLNLNELDRNLTEQERQEWNDIYASFRSKSVLTGKIIGVEAYTFNVRNNQTGQMERKRMYCAAVIPLKVKILIPETEMWMPGEERPSHVLRNMSGAEIDFVILDVDRKGYVATASRRMAMMIKRRAFDRARGGHELGERLPCRILNVGPSRCLVECGGRDLTLRYQDMSYTSYSDLRKKYRPGDPYDCVLKEYDPASGKMRISIKEATPNPFEGAELRHPLGSRRQAVISGKYGGGVFCTMPDGTTCLCLHTAQHTDRDFQKGDTVIVVIVKFDYEKSLIYGRILSKW